MPLVVVWLPLPRSHCTVSPRLTVTDEGEKAKLEAVTVTTTDGRVVVVVGGTVVVVVIVVVGTRVVVGAGGHVVVVARVVVGSAAVVVETWPLVVVELAVVVDDGVPVVVARKGSEVVEPVSEMSVTPLPQAISTPVRTSTKRIFTIGRTEGNGGTVLTSARLRSG